MTALISKNILFYFRLIVNCTRDVMMSGFSSSAL